MSTVIHRETGMILTSVHTPDYQNGDWVINPAGVDAVIDVPSHYRVVEKDTVREATKEEKAKADLLRLPQLKAAKREEISDAVRDALLAAKTADLTSVAKSVTEKYIAAVGGIEAAKTVSELSAISVEDK